MSETTIDETVRIWKDFVDNTGNWQELVKGVEPKQTQCGPVYEPVSPLDRPNESFAISDMRKVKLATPHYHKGGETEIYIVVSGTGITVVGGEVLTLEPGMICVTPPNIAHFTIPQKDLVLVVINTPPFKPENVVDVTDSNPEVGFDAQQLSRLV